MVLQPIETVRSLSPVGQLIVTSLVVDPLGFVAGYLLGPSLGLSPLLGGVVGLAICSTPVTLWMLSEHL